MREIKFRQWIKSSKSFHYWGYIIEHEAQSFHGKYFDPPLGPMDDDRRESQQFTGLLDKSGREIYEGDIVKDVSPREDRGKGRNIWEVVWKTNEYMVRRLPKPNKDNWDWMTSDDGYIYYGPKTFEDFKVIGNIHENPEFLDK